VIIDYLDCFNMIFLFISVFKPSRYPDTVWGCFKTRNFIGRLYTNALRHWNRILSLVRRRCFVSGERNTVCVTEASSRRALIEFWPGVIPHKVIINVLLAAPVLNTATVSLAAMRTLRAPQNLVLGHLDQRTPLTASFWFWVIPFNLIIW
jgi:hypothetical protein